MNSRNCGADLICGGLAIRLPDCGANSERVLVLAAAGLALGLADGIAGTRLLTSVLFQVKPNDPPVYFVVGALLGLVILLACYIPARRAAGVDTVTALRQE